MTDICFETGFNNLSNFNRQFLSFCGYAVGIPAAGQAQHAKIDQLFQIGGAGLPGGDEGAANGIPA